jgi:hypothetical protein
MKLTEQQIHDKAEEYARIKHNINYTFFEAKREAFISGFTACQSLQVENKVDHLQPSQVDPVEFLNWTEDNGYQSVWSNKFKLRRWTQESVLVNGSAEHFDRLVKDGIDASDLVEIFKKERGM